MSVRSKVESDMRRIDLVPCRECVYWEPTSKGSGECRRHAPQVKILSKQDLGDVEDDWPTHYANWPTTTEDDWCAQGKAEEL